MLKVLLLCLQVPSLASRSNAKPYLGVTSIPLPRAVPPAATDMLFSTKAKERRRRQEEVEVRAALHAMQGTLLALELDAMRLRRIARRWEERFEAVSGLTDLGVRDITQHSALHDR